MSRPKRTIDCPICGKRGRKRSGVHFDNEWYCKDCYFTWNSYDLVSGWIIDMINKLHDRIESEGEK